MGSNGSSNGYSQTQSSILYDCYGISNHSGGLSGGHYTAYCRHPNKSNNWHLYNDRCVSGANPDHVVSAEAYLLFFERVGNFDENDNSGGNYIC
jgi:ubiquitin C-terminal hydrolase